MESPHGQPQIISLPPKVRRVEYVSFNGVVFRRYPDSPKKEHRTYYSPGFHERRAGMGALHQEIWKHANGPIPAGFHIHHINGDANDNRLENLECKERLEHLSDHHKERLADPVYRAKLRANLDRIRPKTKAWHASPEGLAWHSENSRKAWDHRVALDKTCDQCGARFPSISRRENDRFCSNRCKSAWRRRSGLDDVQRVCAKCGGTFTCNKYSNSRFCSRLCARHSRHWKRGCVQPGG